MINDNIRLILEDAYQRAESGHNTDFELSELQQKWVETIVEKAESQKAVLAVLITSLTKKIETPTQDVRYHKTELPNGYSGRTFDTSHVTPFIAEKFQRFAMKSGSGWLTRSLEQAHPYTLTYPGRILDKAVRKSFLQILNDIEENQVDPKKYLHTIFAALINLIKKATIQLGLWEKSDEGSAQVPQSDTITIDNIVNLLKYHFSYNYRVAGASRLPVLAVFSAYEMLTAIERYKGKTLSPLKSHTTSDTKSGGIGDIEVLDENGGFFEAVEIKHDIQISADIVEKAYEKFAETSVCRYYLLTTAEPNTDNPMMVDQIIQKIHRQHGCEVIVNGIIPSLKYYLRLLTNPELFLACYSRNLKLDFEQNTDIKEIHLRYWNELLESQL
ncbi:DNA methyltransferase [Candidatus Poribacteria bacterium]|nr:MAG: DNA methyltransferase [Candidatus Poribacteria bacterium]